MRIFDAKYIDMKGKISFWLFLLPITLALSSCEDCNKCGIEQQEPYFNVKFFNARQLLVVNDSIALVDNRTKNNNLALTSSNSFLNTLLDSLDLETDPIAIESLEFKVDSVTFTIDTIGQSTSRLNASKSKLNQVKRKIERGAVPLSSITSPRGGEIRYMAKDSLESYRFPLDMNNLMAEYFIDINDQTYTLEVAYSTNQIVDNGSVVITADNLIFLHASPFDSVKVYYTNDIRKTDETHIHLYF